MMHKPPHIDPWVLSHTLPELILSVSYAPNQRKSFQTIFLFDVQEMDSKLNFLDLLSLNNTTNLRLWLPLVLPGSLFDLIWAALFGLQSTSCKIKLFRIEITRSHYFRLHSNRFSTSSEELLTVLFVFLASCSRWSMPSQTMDAKTAPKKNITKN